MDETKALNDFYPRLKEMYQWNIEDEGYTKVQSFYSMIEVFALFISKNKQQKIIFYTAMMELMKEENLDERECCNVIHSYEQVTK